MNMQIDYETERELGIDYETLAVKVADKVLEMEKCPYDAQVNLVLTDNEEIERVNTEFRDIARPTDVLSFPMIPFETPAGYDIEIVEKHHNQKLDAPSGTALALADSINEAMGNPYEYVYDRSQRRQKRDKKELGISAVRGGTIVGDHDVIFAGKDEVITFSHTAYSKAVFGKGAVAAAKFLKGKTVGRYEMADVIAAN